MERIGREDKPGTTNSIELYAARGEYEPFQIIIQAPPGGLKNVNVTVSNLYGKNQQIIPQQNITLYREHYVHVRYSSPKWGGTKNPPLNPGWYADGLIPFLDPVTGKPPKKADLKAVPFQLVAKQNQPIWGDIFVPRNTQPGQYTGKFTVTSSQGKVEGKILLKVWNFELPLKPSLNSSFSFWEAGTKSANEELLKHKLMPEDVNTEDKHELVNKWGLVSTNLGFWSKANIKNCQMVPAPSVKQLQTTASRYQPGLLLYNYTADEIDNCPNLYTTIKQWARNLHSAGIANLITMKPVPELYDDGLGNGRSAVDIWVLLPRMYDEARERVLYVLNKGNQVWSYNALVQDDYSPKWEIDFEPINFRIQPGFISQSLSLTGLLYWRIDLWTKDPWHDVQTFFADNHNYPGEGMLVYPGKQVGIEGVVPSMRLKWLREGVEDYEYIEILKKLARRDWALAVSRGVARDWKNWTRDPKVLESARHRLGEEIERLSSTSK
ncbi:DUF4091 domain-containing protein [Chlorogloeopsis sp. ULAP01]|uniref:DUF4091 domain-containing protein n=1 Tax=Chlorogloeopsis sp. ULAP01 TaxID=3056483 RepID=UPI0025AB2D28|nr:glycoside hydrolase domain-containing protein [Chlorogloeopsis sp. ULAP01]MDM9381280.1 DUF4091 domain-containing protein [Chlorogloeopsis sp. ULAP01]